MSKRNTPHAQKRGRRPSEIHKIRPSISLDPHVVEAARQLAFNSGQSLSAWIEQLMRDRTNYSPEVAK